MEEIEKRVKSIVSEQLGIKLEDIKSDSKFVDDLGADSLDTVELVMALEEALSLRNYLLPILPFLWLLGGSPAAANLAGARRANHLSLRDDKTNTIDNGNATPTTTVDCVCSRNNFFLKTMRFGICAQLLAPR